MLGALGKLRYITCGFDLVTGSLFHPKAGVIQSIVILDGQGHLFPSPFQFWKEKDSHQNKSKYAPLWE